MQNYLLNRCRTPFSFHRVLRGLVKQRYVIFFLFIGVTILSENRAQSVSSLKVTHLKVNGLSNPLGVHPASVRLGWQLQSEQRNVRQTAYEIRLTAGKGKAAGIWQSGKVISGRSVDVSYGGPALKSNTEYQWQVRVWDHQGTVTSWSTAAMFHTAFSTAQDWKASWITPGYTEDSISQPCPLFRKEFGVGKKVAAAILYITAQGMYEARLNGQKVGDALLTPGWTSYQTRLQYQVFNVTGLLRSGVNAMAVTLGKGWYRSQVGWVKQGNFYGKSSALLAQLEISYTDGSRQTIITDRNWKSNTGAIRSSEIYHGEVIDLRLHQSEWDQPGFNDNAWYDVQENDFDKQRLIPTINEPVKAREVFKPLRIFKTPTGELAVDFGQNLVGWVRLKVKGKAGDSILVTHAEVLDKYGNMYYENLRSAKCRNIYITDGKGEAVFHPHFTWQGFRYAAIKGYPGVLTADDVEAVAIYSDMELSGQFTTGHKLINQLQHNIQWGQRGNFLDVPTDCPQRDERLGWTGDAQAFSRTAAFNFNVRPFFAKWLQDVKADQVNGAVPHVVPNVLAQKDVNSSGWSDVATIVPWNMYLAYGDTALLERQYASMKDYLESIRSVAVNDLWNNGRHYGDWLFFRPFDDNDGSSAVTDKYLIAQCFYTHSADIVAKTAAILGKTAESRQYRDLAQRLREAFCREYLTPTGRLVSGTQTAYVLALQFDMLPEPLRQQAAGRLAANVEQYGHITTGFLGTPYICHVLTRYGYHHLATKLLLREKYPSWLYPVTMGATTIWERWDGQKPDSSFQNPGMNSFNHYAYGAIGDWLYRVVAGLDSDEQAPGYRKLRIVPHPVKELGDVKATLQTPYGPASSGWKVVNGQAELEVVVPPNTTAVVSIPCADSPSVNESGKSLTETFGSGSVTASGGRTLVETGSGTYRFVFPFSFNAKQ